MQNNKKNDNKKVRDTRKEKSEGKENPNTINPIQWFPGHMAKTRRIIKECLPLVDIVVELLDARIPYSSKNPEIESLIENKPKLIVLNKSSLADDKINSEWIAYYKNKNESVILLDCVTGQGLNKVDAQIKEVLSEKLQRYKEKGMDGRKVRAMIVGIPNVGKSSLINRLCGNYKAKVEDRPGVTLIKQWVPTTIGIDLLDMPGVLWPKFDDATVGENLGITGAIKDNIMDIETLSAKLCERLKCSSDYMELLCTRYKIQQDETDMVKALETIEKEEIIGETSGFRLLELIARKRGFIVSGGEIDIERCANTLLNEFRNGKIGRISLERP